MCPGHTDFIVANKGLLAFKEIGVSEIVGFVSCGGCSGKKAASRAKMMVDKGAEVIAFASCIFKGNPIGFPCPHADQMKRAVEKTVGDGIKILDYTH